MSIVYYMPVFVKQKALETNDADLLRWCELFKIFNSNACFLDRTGAFQPPFETEILYPIPASGATASFSALCLARAAELLRSGAQINVMYSGGLDSTTALVAFDRCIKSGIGVKEQLVVAATPESIAENPIAWWNLVLPNYQVVNASALMSKINLNERYVQGEHSDQVFGAALISPPEFVSRPFTPDNLISFLKFKNVDYVDWLYETFKLLVSRAPLEIATFRDFFWWINFSCKWQSVALRTLAVTSVLRNEKSISLQATSVFDTFFNTVEFQKLAMNGTLAKQGTDFSPYAYKAAARSFILGCQPTWREYTSTKVKMPSLHNVFRQSNAEPIRAIEKISNDLYASTLFD